MDGAKPTSSRRVAQLDPSVVRAISTGQVVSNIAGACKELIENALDAGATSLEIRLVDYGLSSLEVSDNGSGIAPGDFEAVARPHWTSKLSQFDHLGALKTYGFRGEALSALAALSKLKIVTRHGSSEIASKLEFGADGTLSSKMSCARVIGTTTIVEGFLEPLPVRRKEFERKAKSEYLHLLNVLQAYGLILKNVRLELSHKLDNGPNKVVLSTRANQTTKENICNVFGAKQLESLLDFVQVPPSKEQLTENDLPENASVQDFVIEGVVSSIEKGAGRSSTDRQFIYVNRRPCDFPKMLKNINDVYHQYNRQQYPVVILNVDVLAGRVDVNVTPDKRQLHVPNESLLLLIIRTSLTTLFDKLRGVCTMGEALSTSSILNAATKSSTPLANLPAVAVPAQCQPTSASANATNGFKRSSGSDFVVDDSPVAKVLRIEPRNDRNSTTVALGFNKPALKASKTTPTKNFQEDTAVHSAAASRNRRLSDSPRSLVQTTLFPNAPSTSLSAHSRPDRPFSAGPKLLRNVTDDDNVEQVRPFRLADRVQSTSGDDAPRSTITSAARKNLFPADKAWAGYRKTREIPFSLEKLRQYHSKVKEENEINYEGDKEEHFHAKITPGDRERAELELKRSLSKADFFRMRVIGQFNQGFIVAKLNDDMFIIDQHAADEKYNYETYQRSASFESQSLLTPIPLELSAAQEQVIVSRLEVFRKNGFNFVADSTKSPGQRFCLSAIPCCSSCDFDKSDVDEIIAALNDSPNVRIYRPEKLRRLFASKACRKSVMIGTALVKAKMQQILRHMGEIEQPWNCPHGRPTIRHLFSMHQIPKTMGSNE